MQQPFGQILMLIAGGSTGTILRYLVYLFADRHLNHNMPWGTLLVNLIGAFVIGVLWSTFERSAIPPALRVFLFIGILGSFTTFSTFAFESFVYLNQGQFKMLLINILANNLGGLLLCSGGYYLAKLFV